MFVCDNFFKNYKIINLCGKGATSRVYKIRNIVTGDLYALKEIKDESNTNEAINLIHPYIRDYLRFETNKCPSLIKAFKESADEMTQNSNYTSSQDVSLTQSFLSTNHTEEKNSSDYYDVSKQDEKNYTLTRLNSNYIIQNIRTLTENTQQNDASTSKNIEKMHISLQSNDNKICRNDASNFRQEHNRKKEPLNFKRIRDKRMVNKSKDSHDTNEPFLFCREIHNKLIRRRKLLELTTCNLKVCNQIVLETKTTINCCKKYYYKVACKYKELKSTEKLIRNTNLYKKLNYIRTLINKLDILQKIDSNRNACDTDDKHNVKKCHSEKKPKYIFYLSKYCSYTLRDLINFKNDKCSRLQIDNKKDPLFYTVINYKAIFYKIVQGVNFLHKKNMIHRDLKPENIFFISAEDLSPRIGDFGCVKENTNEDNDTQMTNDIGTEVYAAPELKDSVYNNRVDIYSLGIILYELINRFTTEMERIEKLTDLKHTAKIDKNSGDSIANAIISKCIDKEYKKRPCATTLLVYVKKWIEKSNDE